MSLVYFEGRNLRKSNLLLILIVKFGGLFDLWYRKSNFLCHLIFLMLKRQLFICSQFYQALGMIHVLSHSQPRFLPTSSPTLPLLSHCQSIAHIFRITLCQFFLLFFCLPCSFQKQSVLNPPNFQNYPLPVFLLFLCLLCSFQKQPVLRLILLTDQKNFNQCKTL